MKGERLEQPENQYIILPDKKENSLDKGGIFLYYKENQSSER